MPDKTVVSKEPMNRHRVLEAIAVMGRMTGSDDRALAVALVSAASQR
jgi:hypothetical protein